MSEKLPHIPSVHKLDDNIKSIVKPMKEILETREGRIGGAGSKSVTYDDLVALGLITKDDIPG